MVKEATIAITVWILITASIVGGLINLYQVVQFVRNRKERFLSSRRPLFIIVYCAISLSISILFTPLLFYYEALAPDGEVKEIMEYCIEFVQEVFTIILLTIVICRAWLLFFDYNFVQATIDNNWKGIINPNQQNVWLDKRKTWGNERFVVIVCIVLDCVLFAGLIPIAVLIALNQSPSYSNILFHYFSIYGLGGPFAIFMLIILYKIGQHKTIEDTFYIQKEIKYLTAIILFRIIGLLLNTAYNSKSSDLFHIFFFFVEVISRFLLVFIQSWWVLHKLKQEKKDTIQKMLQKQFTMNEIFKYENGLLLFIRHCVDEISVEHILFLIEVCQYKDFINNNVSKLGQSMASSGFVDVFAVDVHVNIAAICTELSEPQQQKQNAFTNFVSTQQECVYNEFREIVSTQKELTVKQIVVFDDDDNETDWIYKYAAYLHKKYINASADLAINIASSTQNNLVSVFIKPDNAPFEHENAMKFLYHVFDTAFIEVWTLIQMDTFRRFKHTKQYYKIYGKMTA